MVMAVEAVVVVDEAVAIVVMVAKRWTDWKTAEGCE